ncbi:FeoC-like transcriptional regulator [Pontiella sp.]|uniref:FeoC-like transcriptional regulator n=1 Tax=Pontiella sp. TaxID=2837462 RepID=UPI003568763A
MLDRIMEVLTPRRTMTVGNLALHFEMEPEEIHVALQQLAADGRVRYAFSKCSGSCSTCSTCSVSPSGEVVEEAPAVDPTAIVISMELRKQDD